MVTTKQNLSNGTRCAFKSFTCSSRGSWRWPETPARTNARGRPAAPRREINTWLPGSQVGELVCVGTTEHTNILKKYTFDITHVRNSCRNSPMKPNLWMALCPWTSHMARRRHALPSIPKFVKRSSTTVYSSALQKCQFNVKKQRRDNTAHGERVL